MLESNDAISGVEVASNNAPITAYRWKNQERHWMKRAKVSRYLNRTLHKLWCSSIQVDRYLLRSFVLGKGSMMSKRLCLITQ